MALTAKLFWAGRSQAVRLPKAFRMEGDEVGIRRQGRRVILEPIAGTFSDDFFAEGRRQPDQQDRAALDRLFD